MKGVIAAICTAAVVAPCALADAPSGFREGVRLEPAASWVAGKPVQVWCATSKAAFVSTAQTDGAHPDGLGYVRQIAGAEMFLSPLVCAYLTAYLNHKAVNEYNYVISLLVLTHEATHLSGSSDESETDCTALKKMPTMIRQFFKPRAGYTVHDLMAEAWTAHRREPSDYTRLC